MTAGKWVLVLGVALLAQQGSAHEIVGSIRNATPLPARKSGLWEVTVRSDEMMLRRQGHARNGPQTVQMCTTSVAEAVMLFAIVPGQQHCHKISVTPRNTKDGGGWDIHTACAVHDNPVDAEMRLTGDLSRKYRGAYSVKYPQTPIHNSGRMLFEGRWLSACAAGQRAGDMVLPNGVTVNVVDDRRRAEAEGGHRH